MISTHSSAARPRHPKVTLLFETTNSYARNLLVGIGEYILSHGPWQVQYAEVGRTEARPAWLTRWDGDGIIIRGENHDVARAVARRAVPVVDMTPSRLVPLAPWVKSNDALIAQLAAQHFLERGFHHFAFCGDARFAWSHRRGEHFCQALRQAGQACAQYPSRASTEKSEATIDWIARWLRRLPKPLAVFACYDMRGQQTLEACRRAGLAVPEEVAVLGVDDDEALCALSSPPLSSIRLNPRRAGWEAAALLARLMAGKKAARQDQLIPPVGVTTRQSTDILAVPDRKIATALRYIREHACAGISVADVLRHCPMARRSLEKRLKKLLGRTPREEILRVRLNWVKDLLIGTNLPVWEIAERSGFEPPYLSVVFKQATGLSPGVFRQRFGAAS